MVPILFLVKKIITQFFMPLSVASILLVVGFSRMRGAGKKNAGGFFVVLGMVLLVLSSYEFIADRFANTLERRYPPLHDPRKIEGYQDIKWVVVLGGGSYQDERLPASSRLADGALTRLLEGVRLYRGLPSARLVLSGGALFQDIPEGRIMADAALLMGVRKTDIVVEKESLDTEDQARLIPAIVGRDRFILVTSAVHMPRAMFDFRKYKMEPIAAPTDYRAPKRPRIEIRSLFPNAESLRTTEMVIHEYLGLLWMRLKP